MADKYHSDMQEKVETVYYQPGLHDSGNLEAGTKAITATSKPASPDYTAGLTTPAVDDSRLKVLRLKQRLNVYIDSFGGTPEAIKLYYSVEVNGVERASGEFTSAGADNPACWVLTEGQFNLGSANQIDIFLWVDQGNATISACQLWQGIDSLANYDWQTEGSVLRLKHRGFLVAGARARRVGTGNTTVSLQSKNITTKTSRFACVNGNSDVMTSGNLTLSDDEVYLRICGSVDTDLRYLSDCTFVLRSVL